MTNIAKLAHATELAIELGRIKERLDEISPVLSAYRWFNAASNVECALDGIEEAVEDMDKVLAMLRDRVHAGGAR